MKASEKTKKRLTDSLIYLMEEKPIDKITIEDITNHAQLTRTTFYNHFSDKYDVINSYHKEILNSTTFQIGKTCSWETATRTRFQKMLDDRLFITRAFQVEDVNSVFSEEYKCTLKVYSALLERELGNPLDEQMNLLIRFYCLGSMKTTAQWICRNMMESPEFMTDLLKEAMPQKLQYYLLNT